MRNQTDYNTIIGINENDEAILLNYIFNHTDGFKGATGSILAPVSQDYIDDRNDIEELKDSYSYLWQEAVKNSQTEESLEDYINGLIESEVTYGSSLFIGHDDSDVHYIDDSFKDEHFPDAVTFECIGGGRIFSSDMKWKVILRPDLLKLVNEVEEIKTLKLA